MTPEAIETDIHSPMDLGYVAIYVKANGEVVILSEDRYPINREYPKQYGVYQLRPVAHAWSSDAEHGGLVPVYGWGPGIIPVVDWPPLSSLPERGSLPVSR